MRHVFRHLTMLKGKQFRQKFRIKWHILKEDNQKQDLLSVELTIRQ